MMDLNKKKTILIKFWEEKSKEHHIEHYSFSFSKRYWAMAWCCYFEGYRKEIVVSEPWIEANTIEDLKQIVLHEMAHAITESRHTKEFRRVAREIGCEERHIRVYSKHRWEGRTPPVLPEKYQK
jgi:predicted SprT family Zn-dependent metalloprotease